MDDKASGPHRVAAGTGGEPPREAARRRGLRRMLPLLVIGLVGAIIWASGVTNYLSTENLVASRDALLERVAEQYWLALALFFLTYASMVALSIPGALLLSVFSGFLFGVYVGVLVTVAAATIGASLLFLAVRSGLAPMLEARAGPSLKKIRAGFHADAASYLLFLRLVPIFPYWLINLASALLGVRFSTFLWTTAVGIVPATFAFAIAGAGLDSLLAEKKAAYASCVASGARSCAMTLRPGDVVTQELILALVTLACIALVPVMLKRWRGRMRT